jgi:hypothetical protein
MRTLQHLRQLGGPNRALGNGPLSRVANQLVEQHDAEEARRMHAARVRAELSGTGPLFDALQRLAAKAGEDALEQVETPFVLRFEAQRALSEASKANPDDRGLRLAKANLYNLWRQDPYGYLTIGKVAEIRRHFMNEFPKSKVASIIDREFPKIGFQTLPLSKLNRIAATIDSQESYDAAILAHGLNGSSPNLIRARAYIRGLVAMGDEQTTEAAEAGGAAAASRAFQQVAQLEDGSSVKVDFPEPGETPMDEPMLDGPPMGEEPMHDEGSEETVTLPSPITGEDLVLELGVAEPEGGLESEDLGPPMDDPEMDDTGGGPPDIEDADVEGLEFMGQLADFGDENAPMDETMPGLDDDAVAMIEDPSSGEMLEVRLTPIREEDAPIEGGDLSGAESSAQQLAPIPTTICRSAASAARCRSRARAAIAPGNRPSRSTLYQAGASRKSRSIKSSHHRWRRRCAASQASVCRAKFVRRRESKDAARSSFSTQPKATTFTSPQSKAANSIRRSISNSLHRST